MELPAFALDRDEFGHESQAALIDHLRLDQQDGIPWSFSLQQIVAGLEEDKEELVSSIESIDWGHNTHHPPSSQEQIPWFVKERLAEMRSAIGRTVVGSSSVKPSPTARLRSGEKRLALIQGDLDFYKVALRLAQQREQNENLRKRLIRWIQEIIESSVRKEMRGTRPKISKNKWVKRLRFTGTSAETSDGETAVMVNTRQITQRPVTINKRRGGLVQYVRHDPIIEDRTDPVLYIDWRRSTISEEQSRRGKTASFWKFMLEWIKEEIAQEIVESLILGMFKGVSYAVKGLYLVGKAVRRTRRLNRVRANEVLGENASRLKRAIDVKRLGRKRPDEVTGPDRTARATSKGRPTKQQRGTRDRTDPVDEAFERTFRGGTDEGEYVTTTALKRGNFGERTATEALAAMGHSIIDFKPDIRGTNQGGIDMVTMRDGIVYFVDNKALTRSGKVSSVSALTTNFQQNLRTARRDIFRRLSSHGTIPEQRRVLKQALEAIDNGHYRRVVTNANLTPDAKILSDVTQALKDQRIGFIDVMK